MEFGKLKEFILVGLSYSKNPSDQVSHIRKFTHTTDNNWKHLTGKSTEHATFLYKVILPHLSNNYHLTDSGHTFIGHSLGGLLGTYMLLIMPTSFNHYVRSSPFIWYDGESTLSVKAIPSPIPHRVFIGVDTLKTHGKSRSLNNMVEGAQIINNKLISEKVVEADSKPLIIPEINYVFHFQRQLFIGSVAILNESTNREIMRPIRRKLY
ncbi:hypothetical protein BTJ40_15260 [Microbulbifer sp. A4B17]|uniref:alpha/beta hydrolase-fold protein n=1 Tax=Microbulbifer sp. A4B17 TaxID=359370 RepID=UPI000D52EC73|nr:alpha/beta hydrolase-fold protein [Microbulbifer sp. A4B17]AWF82077.1 hypothetical protein BTJ40_15260 [Microbulbifer sp. A4B17]